MDCKLIFGDSYKQDWKKLTEGYPRVHVITDPPYTEYGNKVIDVADFCGNIVDEGSLLMFSPLDVSFLSLNCDPDEYILWIKALRTMNFTKRCGASSFVEKISVFRWSLVFNALHWQQMTGVCYDLHEEKLLHPYQKPEALLRRLILIYTDPGDLVVDPFMGVGTAALACKKTGRHFIGAENEEMFYDIAKKKVFGE
jgi:hypothetical protein